MLHASALKVSDNQGLLFSGTSGDGKSTTVKLWQKSGKGILLGDERIAVRKIDGKFWLFSTPWHGSGQPVGADSALLDQLFILQHGSENHARRLKPAEAVSLLLARAYLPFWDRDGMEFSLAFLEDLCSSFPCYEFAFVPDQSAVEYIECLLST